MSDPKTLEYGKPAGRRGTNVPLPLALVIIAAATVLLWIVIGPDSHPRAREKANQIRCASNLRQIGQAIMLYAQDNQGMYPPDPQTLAATQQIALACFVCPITDDTPASAVGQLTLPSHESYIYLDAGLTTNTRPEGIIALEDPAHHKLQGGNVLFVDGHVEFFDLPTIQLFLNELDAGRNPPATLTPTLSKAGAEQDYEKHWKSRMPQLRSGAWHIPTTQPTAPK